MEASEMRLLGLVASLSQSEGRQAAAGALARELGAEDLMIYIWDDSVAAALPAPGFLQTLPGGHRWSDFVDSCKSHSFHGILPWGDKEVPAVGFKGSCDSVLVLLGGKPDLALAKAMALLLPLLSAAFASDRANVLAAGSVALAEQSAHQSRILAASLEKARNALREALAEAEAAHRTKDQFLATLSHELRTPLTPVLLLATALENDGEVPGSVRADITTIRKNVELEVQLIDDLLDLSRIVTGKMRLRNHGFDINAAARSAIAFCRPMVEDGKIILHEHLAPHLPIVYGDGTRIQQVLWNLLRNAAKFTPAAGRITVTTELSSAGRVRATVADSGIGINSNDLGKIFGAFQQVFSATLLEGGGLGLGLAISKAIVDMHGGSIAAHSAGLGKGASFIVELPVGVAVESAGGESISPPSSGGEFFARILLVEDNSATATALQRLLQRSNHKVTVCGTVATALAAVDQQHVDLVLSDLGLPDGTGFELMQTISSRYAIPGIAMSGYGTDSDRKKSQAAGFAEHLIKPVRIDQVLAAIQAILQRQSVIGSGEEANSCHARRKAATDPPS